MTDKNNQNLLKTSLLIVTVLLGACSSARQFPYSQLSQRPLAESFAYERAASIAQVTPVQVGRFVLEEATANHSSVYLSLRAVNIHDTNAQTLISEINAIGYGLCQDTKTALVIQQGVAYHLSIFNADKIKLTEAIINSESCKTKNFSFSQNVSLDKSLSS